MGLNGGRRERRASAGALYKFIQFRFECCGIFFPPDKGICLFVKGKGPCDFAIVYAGGSQDEFLLEQEDVFAFQARTCQEHDPGNGLRRRCNHGRDQPAFTVANEAGFLWVNFLAGFQVNEGGFGICDKILRRRVRVVAGGLADPRLSKRRTAMPFRVR